MPIGAAGCGARMEDEMTSGYTPCACRDCFEIAISSDVKRPEFCHDCAEAGCIRDTECSAPGAYGCDEDQPEDGPTAEDERGWDAREDGEPAPIPPSLVSAPEARLNGKVVR